MAWTLNGIRIFVQESNVEGSQIIPRLQPLSGQTILQIFGYESRINTLVAIVVGSTDINAIMALRKTGLSYTLMTPEGSAGSYYVQSVQYKRLPSICQTLRPDLPEDAPVYTADIKLYPTSD